MLDIEAVKQDRMARVEHASRDYDKPLTIFGALSYTQDAILFGGTVIDGKETPMTEEQVKETIEDCRAKEAHFESIERKVYWDLVATLMGKYIK